MRRPNVADVTTFGARGNGFHDDTHAIQKAIDSLYDRPYHPDSYPRTVAGGVVFFPPGRYRHHGLTIAGPNIALEGCGLASRLDHSCTLLMGHDIKVPMIEFDDEVAFVTPFRMCGVSMELDGVKTNNDKLGTCGIKINTGKQFRRYFQFERVGILSMEHGILLNANEGDGMAVGDITITNCLMQYNHYGMYSRLHPSGSAYITVNGLTIRDSPIRQNVSHGIHVSAMGASIDRICVEGQPFGIEINHGCSGVVVQACYGESNKKMVDGVDVGFAARVTAYTRDLSSIVMHGNYYGGSVPGISATKFLVVERK